jgi:hypothetical protein
MGGKISAMKRWQFWLGVGISAIFLYLALRDINFALLWKELLEANYLWLVPGVIVFFIALWVRSWRWHYMLRPLKTIPTRKMFPIVTIGYAFNNIFPARAGEILRAVLLKQDEDIPISASIATIIVERVFDGIVMLAFVFINLSELARLTGVGISIGNLDISIQDMALWGSLAFFGALVVFILAAMFPTITMNLISWIVNHFVPVRFRESVLTLSKNFLSGLEYLRSPKDVLMVFFTSVVIWLLETVKYWFVMHAFDFAVGFFALMLVNGVFNLASTIPSAPGYWGTSDLPSIEILKGYGVVAEVATAYTFVLHFALWFPVTALGLYYMAREGIKLNQDIEKMKVEA